MQLCERGLLVLAASSCKRVARIVVRRWRGLRCPERSRCDEVAIASGMWSDVFEPLWERRSWARRLLHFVSVSFYCLHAVSSEYVDIAQVLTALRRPGFGRVNLGARLVASTYTGGRCKRRWPAIVCCLRVHLATDMCTDTDSYMYNIIYLIA